MSRIRPKFAKKKERKMNGAKNCKFGAVPLPRLDILPHTFSAIGIGTALNAKVLKETR